MSKSKDTTKAEQREKLARDLAAVLANPEIPACLYNGISEAIAEFESECINYDALLYSAETIGKALEMYAEKGGAR